MKINFVDLKRQYQSIKEDVQKEIAETLEKCDFILGSKVEEFERSFAKYCATNYAIGVGSGTAALRLALQVFDLNKDDEVIMPVNTFFATAEAAMQIGLKPVFVDINPETYCIDVSKIEERITEKTKVIIPVHLYGQCADMDGVNSLAQKHSLHVIEDACQAHGATYKGKKAGSMGDVGCFSFYPGKNLGAYGEGGACVTNDDAYCNKIKMLRNHGSESKYKHVLVGDNSRLETLQAGVLVQKLKRLDDWNTFRRNIAQRYSSALQKSNIKLPYCEEHNVHVYHLFVIQCEDRDNLQQFLGEKEIATGLHYPIPLHLQKACSYLGYQEGDFPACEASCKKILSLPIFPELTEEEVEFITGSILSFYAT
jgi:dTDP-4-amino-4,6-dideoxygalactose transaminase